MVNDRPDDSAGQVVCTGQLGNHGLPQLHDARSVFRSAVPSRREYLKAVEALPGEACVGVFRTHRDRIQVPTTYGWGTVLTAPDEFLAFHARTITFMRGGDGFSDPNNHAITMTAGERGEPCYSYRLDGLAPVDVADFIATWERSWNALRGGRPAGTTAVSREEWDAALTALKPRHRRRDELIAAMARRLSIDRDTARSYVSKRGWPI